MLHLLLLFFTPFTDEDKYETMREDSVALIWFICKIKKKNVLFLIVDNFSINSSEPFKTYNPAILKRHHHM